MSPFLLCPLSKSDGLRRMNILVRQRISICPLQTEKLDTTTVSAIHFLYSRFKFIFAHASPSSRPTQKRIKHHLLGHRHTLPSGSRYPDKSFDISGRLHLHPIRVLEHTAESEKLAFPREAAQFT